MKVKKFKATTMPEAMHEVRKELGSDAVILNSKIVHDGGFLGLFKKRKIEVLAAIDPSTASHSTIPTKKNKFKEAPIKQPTSPGADTAVLDEVREIKKWIQTHGGKESIFQGELQDIYQLLIENEVKESFAFEIVESVAKRMDDSSASRERVLSEIQEEINQALTNCGNFGGDSFKKRYIHLVGPTGVGKTTTIAKLAAHAVLTQGKKVAFITTDTYRIAAIEQLKTYSKILNIPIEVAYNLEDYKKSIEKFASYDLVLVDTAGRNFKDKKYVEELSNIIDLDQDIDTFLVLSLTTRSKDMEEIFSQFKNVPIRQVIFTKSDETSTFGSMLNLCKTFQIGVAYITNGQDVPDDIQTASIQDMSRQIIGVEKND